MQGKFFGYTKETPCPKCKGSRVGLDFDDDYYIVSGVLRETSKNCEQKKITHCNSFSPKETDMICPRCGGEISWKSESCRGPRGTTSYIVGSCHNSQKRTTLERTQGCPECYESGSHTPLHSD